MSEFLKNKYVAAALSGVVAALVVDYRTYRRWLQSDRTTPYDWRVAGMRVLDGAIAGVLAAAGVSGAETIVS